MPRVVLSRSQFKILIKIVFPGIWGLFKTEAQGQQGDPDGYSRFPDQEHICLLWRPPSLSKIAHHAACHHIGPFRLPPPGARDDVVIGQLLEVKGGSAILTRPPIPKIEILARELDQRCLPSNVPIQPNHGGKSEHACDPADQSLVFLNHLDLLKKNHGDCLFPWDNDQRFKSRVK